MSDIDTTLLSVEVIDEHTTFTLAELCRACAIDAELIEAMIEHGILEPSGTHGRHPCFPATSLRRARITVNLRRDLGVNMAGAALALELLEHIDRLSARQDGGE